MFLENGIASTYKVSMKFIKGKQRDSKRTKGKDCREGMMDWLDEIEKRVDCLQPYDMDRLISEVLRLNHERNVLCEAIDSILANVGIIRKDALPSPPELIMFLQEDAEEMITLKKAIHMTGHCGLVVRK